MSFFLSQLPRAVLLTPLFFAAVVAIAGMRRQWQLVGQLARLGAGMLASLAVAGLMLLLVVPSPTSRIDMGDWLRLGPRDNLAIRLGFEFDLLAGLVIAATAVAAGMVARSDASTERRRLMVAVSSSLLLFASSAFAMATNLAAMLLFWGLQSVAAYVMLAAQAEWASRGVAAKKVFLVQRLADVAFAFAVFMLAIAFPTLDRTVLFESDSWSALAAAEPAAVNFAMLGLLAACTARCGLFPLLGWIRDLADFPAATVVMLQGACLAPAGIILWARMAPVVLAATAAASLRIFLCGLSAAMLAGCAYAAEGNRARAAYACGSATAASLLLVPYLSPAQAGVLIAASIAGSSVLLMATPAAVQAPIVQPFRAGTLPAWARRGYLLDEFLFVFVLMPIRGYAQLARFFDWFLVDRLVTGLPTAALRSAYAAFAPMRRRSALFYFASALGTACALTLLIVWLRR